MEHEKDLSSSSRSSHALQYLRGIQASVSEFLAWLWSKLRAPFQNMNDSVHPQDNTNDKGTDSQDKYLNAIPLKSNFPPAPTNKKKSYKKCQKRLQVATFVVEVLGLLGLIVYACLTYLMYRETKKAANAAHDSAVAAKSAADTADATLKSSEKSFIIDQRPYMVVVEGFPLFLGHPPTADQPIQVNVVLKNIGKTPAIQVATGIRLVPYRAKLLAKLSLEERRNARKEYISFIQGQFATLRIVDEKIRKEITDLKKLDAGQDVAPTKTYFLTTDQPVSISETEFPLLKTGEITLYIIGIASYTDSYGVTYKTEFCDFYFGADPTVWHICDSHNTIR
ncbi:MAG: hypothetical protein ABSE19_04620 [Candidatus Acidiferrum sp.]